MSLHPKRLGELPVISFETDGDSDPKKRSTTPSSTQPVKLQPKRLQELYSESFDSDEFLDDDDLSQQDHSSGFDERVDGEANSSTPIGSKENNRNACNRSGTTTGTVKSIDHSSRPIELTDSKRPPVLESTKVSTVPLTPRSLMFSPIKLSKPVGGPRIFDDLFATPSVKPPPTTGRVIFSSSQHKPSQPRKTTQSDYQRTLFTTPQQCSIAGRPTTNNTSDYATDSFNSLKKTTSTVSVLSPIDEERISIDDFQGLGANGDGEALANKVLEINGRDFVIKKKIGCGGSCSVYSAKCKSNGADRALKVVNLPATDPSSAESYLNEAKLLERFQGNDSVIKLFESLHRPDKHSLFLVMELGDTDLNRVLKAYQSDIPLTRIVSYWHQMLTAVQYIHSKGVIHSDLKPANFLLVNGRLKLIDFGIASNISLDATSVIKFSQTGTLNYISPEALIDVSPDGTPTKNKYKISTKSDVWSLGCIFYLCVYRRGPFSQIKNFYAKFSAITSSATAIEYPPLPIYYPAMLIEIIRKCLQFNPKVRSSVADLLKYPMNLIDESIS